MHLTDIHIIFQQSTKKYTFHSIASEIISKIGQIFGHKSNLDKLKDTEPLKLLEENIVNVLYNTIVGKNILNGSLGTQELRLTNVKWNFIK